MPIEKWVQIHYQGRDGWVLPIWTAHNAAQERGDFADLPEDTRELGISISTRLSMLPSAYGRVERGAKAIYDKVSNRPPDHESTRYQDGYALRIPNSLLYSTLLDIDALLFEVKSSTELMETLFGRLYQHTSTTLPGKDVGRSIRDLLKAAGQDTRWFQDLASHRNFFLHEGAPFVAIDLTREASGSLDLLIMKKNLQDFDEPRHFLSLSSIQSIVLGFERSKRVVQKHLIEFFKC